MLGSAAYGALPHPCSSIFSIALILPPRLDPMPKTFVPIRCSLPAHVTPHPPSETEGYLRAREEEAAREQERMRQLQEEREAQAAQVSGTSLVFMVVAVWRPCASCKCFATIVDAGPVTTSHALVLSTSHML